MSIQKANKNDVRKEIADLINRIKEQSDRIGMQREIPQTELDVILHRIEELHRKTVVWSYLNELRSETVLPDLDSARSDNTAVTSSDLDFARSDKTQDEPEEHNLMPEPVDGGTENLQPEALNPEPVSVPPVVNPAPAKKQYKDIRTFIGFNEKLMYIRQVFGGDSSVYEEALNQVNQMNSYDEAEAYLSVLASEYKWNKDNEPVAIFMQTVKRRFA